MANPLPERPGAPRGDSCLIRALYRRKVEYTPVWVMRQAGRYLPEYRRLRARAGSFAAMYKVPEYACAATLQPLERYPRLDAAILFSDILTVPEAMGMELTFIDGRGPVFASPLHDPAGIRALSVPDPEEALGFVLEAARLARAALDERVPLIGFAGAPWTLACYMLQGEGSADFQRPRSLAYEQPGMLHGLLERLAAGVAAYLEAQAAAGADALMVFDSCAGWLDRERYREFSLRHLREVCATLSGLRGRVPLILYARGAGGVEADIAACGFDAVGVDWTRELSAARRLLSGRAALQGNLDPCALFGPEQRVREAVGKVLSDYGPGPGHVFNLGHGIHRDTDPDGLAVLIDSVHQLSRPYHAGAGR